MKAIVPITATGLAASGVVRFYTELPPGLTVEQMVEFALPGATEADLRFVRVVLVYKGRKSLIQRRRWHRTYPHAGVHLVISVLPGKAALRTVLQILVAVAAAAITGFVAGTAIFASTFGTGLLSSVIKSGIQLGLTALGGLLITALLPPSTDDNDEKSVHAIGGFKNRITPDAPFPVLLGEMRYAGPFGMYSWAEVVADALYTRANIVWGLGEHEITNLRLGDTAIEKYDEFQIETYTGLASDPPVSLTNYQVIEVPVGADLLRNYPRDDTGEKIPGSEPESSPVTRNSATDTQEVRLIFSFPAGMIWVNDKGKKQHTWVKLKFRYRLVGDEDWIDGGLASYWHKKEEGFYRQHTLILPERGEWEIEVENLKPELFDENGGQMIDRCTWAVIQSVRPEYPFNADFPLAQTALRIKATAQINGQLDNINADLKRVCLDWDAGTGTWISRATRNCASLAQFLLQSSWNVRPVPDSAIDFEAFQAWHEFCTDKGLNYDRMHDFQGWTDDALKAIGAAGRAIIRLDGLKWTVIIDRPDELIVDHISARNSSGLRWSAEYSEFPDAVRVQFLDRTRKYQPGERVVPWPADVKFANLAAMNADLNWPEDTRAEDTSTLLYYRKAGAEGVGSWVFKPIETTEQMELPGKTDPDEIWIEARRRMYEIIYRSVSYQATQRGLARIAKTGSKVMIARDVLLRAMHSARVKAVRGNHVEIDEQWTLEAGKLYDVRFRVFPVENDPVGQSATRAILTTPGEVGAVVLTGTGASPVPGTLIHIGPRGDDGIPAIVTRIERGRDDASIITMLPAAEIIDELTDAEVPPDWNGRVGTVVPVLTTLHDDEGYYLIDDVGFRLIDDILPRPEVPEFVSILTTGYTDDEVDPTDVVVLLRPATGSDPVVGFQLDHRLVGGPSWTTVASNSSAVIVSGYDFGDQVEFKARAVGANGEISDDTHVTDPFRVGGDLEFMPEVGSFDAIRLTSGLWRYEWSVAALAVWQTAIVVAGAQIRYRLGAWASWDDLLPVHTGLATTSPWDASTPIPDGVYTMGIKLIGDGGEESSALLIYAIAPAMANALFTDDSGNPLTDDAEDYLIED